MEHGISPILKVVDYCNFDCYFCRYHTKKDGNKMSIELYKTIIENTIKFNLANNLKVVSIDFHGGEPLLWGLDNFKQAVAFQQEMKGRYPTITFSNHVQTNGSLLDEQWIDFFRNNNFVVGVSIDGPDSCNFHGAGERNKLVLENIRQLDLAGCFSGILSVITDKHKGLADDYYNFIVNNNIHSIGFIYCVYEDDAGITVDNGILSEFLIRLFDRYYYGDYQLNIREFEDVMRKILNKQTISCIYCDHQNCGHSLSITPHGDVAFCDTYTIGKDVLGNISDSDFFQITQSPLYKSLVEDTKKSIDLVCKDCEIHDICGGGCYRNTLPNGKNSFCETYKTLYPHIKKTIEHLL